MAPSRLCSDEELRKAKHDLKELIARRQSAEGFNDHDPGHVEEGGKEEGMEKKGKVGKKKKMCVLPKEQVEAILNYQCGRLHDNKTIHRVAQEDEVTYGDLRTLVTAAGALTKRYHDIIRAGQEEMRREVETKGYFAYEATNDEAEEDDDESATLSPQQKDAGGHRPGIVKHAGGLDQESKLSL